MTPVPQMTFEGAAGGMNLAISAHEIGDNQAVYIQDTLLNKPGLLVRRGPVKPVVGVVADTLHPAGIVQTTDPQGNTRVAVIHGDGSTGSIGLLNSTYSAVATNYALPFAVPGDPVVVVDAKPRLSGGVNIGIANGYDLGGTQVLAIWRGGISADYTTGTIQTQTGSPATKTIIGAGTGWTTSNVTPGMFLIDNVGRFIGVVQSVDSATQITLENWATFQVLAGNTYTLTSIRGFVSQVRTGLLSTSTGAATVTGSGTKFKSQTLDTTYSLFRASDAHFVGTVSSVSNDSGLTLAGNAAISMANEPYVAFSTAASHAVNITTRVTRETPGFLNAIWDRRQWYGNLNHKNEGTGEYITRIWASDEGYPEAVDFDPAAGNYIDIPSTKEINTPLHALVPAFDSLVVLKENEAHAIIGTSGNYSSKKISDDGALCGMSAVSWGAGAVWAGREGLWMYDGMQAVNITENSLGDYWKSALAGFNPTTKRMWGMVYRDHYVLHIEAATPPRGVIKGATSTVPTHLVVVVYLPTKAVSLFTNVNLRGAIQLPPSAGSPVWYIVNTSSGSAICDAASLFQTSGLDTVTCDSGTAGPSFYFESKRYSLGDGMLKKAWKWLAMQYLSTGDALVLDTVLGLNAASTTANSQFLPTAQTWDTLSRTVGSWDQLATTALTWDAINASVYQAHRVKFLKRSQFLGFRLYQAGSATADVVIGPWALAYKTMPGKV